MHEAGKGDSPRIGRDDSAYSSGWDRIFGKKITSSSIPTDSSILPSSQNIGPREPGKEPQTGKQKMKDSP